MPVISESRINIGVEGERRDGVVRMLNTLLSDETVLYIKTRNYHWNVTGINFHGLHEFFEKQYKDLEKVIDEVAEFARSYGGFALGTMQEYLKNARLREKAEAPPSAQEMLTRLLEDHESLVRYLREDLEKADSDLHSAGANDFLTGLMEKHQTMAWMLRAHLEGR